MTRSRSKPRRQSYHCQPTSQNGPRKAYSLYRLTLLFVDKHLLGSRWCRCIIVSFLAQQLQELLRMLLDQLGQLRVSGAHLLKDGLQHLRLGLDDLAKLLELRVISKEVEICGASSSSSSCSSITPKATRTWSGSTSTSTSPCTSGSRPSATGLGRCLEKIYWLVACVTASICGRCVGSCASGWLLWGSRLVLPSTTRCTS